MAIWVILVSFSELNIFCLAVFGLDDKKLGYITEEDQGYQEIFNIDSREFSMKISKIMWE